MPQPERISPDEVRQKRRGGEDLLLVCAYDDDEKCERLSLDGSIALSDLEAGLPQISKDREIVFYCT